MWPFKQLSAWWRQCLVISERKRRIRIKADPELREHFSKRLDEVVKAGVYAAFFEMEQAGDKLWTMELDDLKFTNGDPFPGKWKVTFERTG